MGQCLSELFTAGFGIFLFPVGFEDCLFFLLLLSCESLNASVTAKLGSEMFDVMELVVVLSLIFGDLVALLQLLVGGRNLSFQIVNICISLLQSSGGIVRPCQCREQLLIPLRGSRKCST